MFKHLLVTLDGSPEAEKVVPHAIDMARAMSASVTLLMVVDAIDSDWTERGTLGKGHVASALVEQARTYLERVSSQIEVGQLSPLGLPNAAGSITPCTVVRQGVPARQILRTAKEVEADAIAMVTHSRQGINRLMLGSVAEEVLHASGLPVLLIRTGTPGDA